jgi:hypothetical protein
MVSIGWEQGEKRRCGERGMERFLVRRRRMSQKFKEWQSSEFQPKEVAKGGIMPADFQDMQLDEK